MKFAPAVLTPPRHQMPLSPAQQRRLDDLTARADSGTLTDADLRELNAFALDRQRDTVRRKALAGTRLTRAEQKLLETAAAGLPTDTDTFVKTWDELAVAVGIDERTLFNFRKDHAKAIKLFRRTLDRPDGRHCVLAWKKFLDEHQVKPRGINAPDPEPDARALQLEILRLDLATKQLKLDRERQSLLPLADFQSTLSRTLSAFRATLHAMPGRAAAKLVQRARAGLLAMLRDTLPPKTYTRVEAAIADAPIEYADIEEILLHEVDLVLATLSACAYLPDEPKSDSSPSIEVEKSNIVE